MAYPFGTNIHDDLLAGLDPVSAAQLHTSAVREMACGVTDTNAMERFTQEELQGDPGTQARFREALDFRDSPENQGA